MYFTSTDAPHCQLERSGSEQAPFQKASKWCGTTLSCPPASGCHFMLCITAAGQRNAVSGQLGAASAFAQLANALLLFTSR